MKHFNIVICFLSFFILTQLFFSQAIKNNQKIIKAVIEKTKQIVFSKLKISKFGLIFVKNGSYVTRFPTPSIYHTYYVFDVIDSKNKNRNKLGCIGVAFFYPTGDMDALIGNKYFFEFKCDNIEVFCNFNFSSEFDSGCK